MSKKLLELQANVKSVGTAYLFFFLLGAHYAYLGKWGLQILFWITFAGLGIWGLIDLFTMSNKIKNYNNPIFEKIEELENEEKDAEHAKNIALITAARGKD